ncbi:MAG: cytidine deaminase [Candidatus Limimorpha sp.]
MRKEQFVLPYFVYDDMCELNEQDADLLQQAHRAVSSAYAPYSGFHVGAAVRLANGETVTGCNIENAAYPSGLCAERVALFRAQAQYPGIAVESIAITAMSSEVDVNEPVAPCGACRQVMAEVELRYKKRLRILCRGTSGPIVAFNGVETLMPFAFDTLSKE